MTANHDTRPKSDNTGGAPSLVGQTTEIDHEPIESQSLPTQRLYIVVDVTQADAARSPLVEAVDPAKQRWLRNNLNQWLRFGCEREMQIGGQTACHPISKHNSQSGEFDRPSNGYHKHGSCTDPQQSDGCLIHDLFKRERMSLRLVTHRPTRRHLWELTLTCSQPADVGLLTEAVDYLDPRDVPVPSIGDVEAQFVNPLYDEKETLRHYQRQGSTVEMIRKDGRWRDTVRDRYVTALRDRLAMSGELAPAIYQGDTDE